MSSEGKGLPYLPQVSARTQMEATIFRRLNDIARVGNITKTDYIAGKVQVTFVGNGAEDSSIVSHWLPWTTTHAHTIRTWDAPEVGSQVLVLCPHGNVNAGVIIGGINYKSFPHEAEDSKRRLSVYDTKEGGAFIEHNRADWVFREWINEEGTFRWEICPSQSTTEGASIIFDQDHIQLRVKDTQLVIKDGEFKVHVKGQQAELILTEEKLLAHIQKNAVLSIEKTAISAELVAEQVRAALTPESIKLAVKTALVEILATTISASVPGTKLTLDALVTTLLTPKFDGVPGTAAAAEYEAGPEVVTVLDPTKAPPELAIGNAPTTPKEP